MNILILGAAGFLGRKIAGRLAAGGALGGRKVTGLTLFDVTPPPAPSPTPAFPVRSLTGDVAALSNQVMTPAPDVIFHLAAVVSAAAEADYDLGRRVNIGGVTALIDACRALAPRAEPVRVVFTSSVASFSGGQTAVLDDDARQIPANSYGAQKAIGELLLADASRRGFLDAVTLRLPTIVVRPGRPNKAASSFLSGILREPLLGLEADLPVPEHFAAWVASPRRAVDWLLHAAVMDTKPMGLDRSVNPPGMSVTVAHMLQALESARPGARALVRRVEDQTIANIVGGWPAAFDPLRARALGFSAHEPMDEVVRAFIADDLDATRDERGLAKQ